MSGYLGRRSWLSGTRFWEVQPVWFKKLWWFVGFPAWLIWGGFIISGTLNEYQTLALDDLGVFGVVAAIGNFFFFRSLFRGDL